MNRVFARRFLQSRWMSAGIALALLASCSGDQTRIDGSAPLSSAEIAARNDWAKDFEDSTLLAILDRTVAMATNESAEVCHAQINIPQDQRLPFSAFTDALNQEGVSTPKFYLDRYQADLVLNARNTEILSDYAHRVAWLEQQGSLVNHYIGTRLIDELVAATQKTMARYSRLLSNLSYWTETNPSVATPETVAATARGQISALQSLPNQLARIRAQCLQSLARASGLSVKELEGLLGRTWTRQPLPLPGISPWIPVELLNNRADVAFAQAAYGSAPGNVLAPTVQSFGLSGTLSSTQVILRSRSLVRDALNLDGGESEEDLVRKQRMFEVIDLWGEIVLNASEDISGALARYKSLGQDVQQLEGISMGLDEELAEQFSRFDFKDPRPEEIMFIIKQIYETDIRLAGLRAKYATSWAFLNIALGYGRPVP